MNKEYLFKFFWAINIVIPVILELLIRIFVLNLYIILLVLPLWIVFQFPLPEFFSWIPLQLGQKSGILLLGISIYFAFAWLDAVYRHFKYGMAIPKSLILWHKEFPIYIKNIPTILGWKKTAILLFSITLLVILLWKTLYQPEVNFDQLNFISDSLSKYETELLSIQQSNDQFKDFKIHRSNIKNLEEKNNTITKNANNTLNGVGVNTSRDQIESIISTVNLQLSDLKSEIIDETNKLGNLKNILDYNNGKLKNLVKSNKKIELNIKSICINNDGQQDSKCSDIEQTTQKLKNSTLVTQEEISRLKSNNLGELQKNYKSLLEMRKPLAMIEEKIENIKGKYLFDIDELNEWFADTKEKLNNLNDQLSTFSADSYAGKINQIQEKYKKNIIELRKIEQSTNNLEKQTELFTILNQATLNKSKLEIIEKDSKQNILDLNLLTTAIDKSKIELELLKSQIGGIHYQSFLYLKKLSQTKYQLQYEKSIQKIKEQSKDVQGKITYLIENQKKFSNELNDQRLNLLQDLGQLTSSLNQLQNKNKRILNKVIQTRVVTIATVGTLVIVVLWAIWIIIANKLKKDKINKKGKLKNNLNSYMENFTDAEEDLDIRLYAVQGLNNLRNPLTEKEIKTLKILITSLGKSNSNNDKKVASKLNKIVESLEIRSSENRRL